MSFFSNQLGFNITLKSEDLFIEKEDRLFYVVTTDERAEDKFILGNHFLKKYLVLFEPENKQMGTFMKYPEKNQEGKSNSTLKWIVVIIVIVGLVFPIGVIYGRKIYRIRRTMANELEEEYSYGELSNKNILYEKQKK